MELPEPGKEGYIVRVTKENRKYLSELYGCNLPLDCILNYDPNTGSLLSDRLSCFREFHKNDLDTIANSTEITVEQLQQIVFIDSLEN